jgi:RNA polymerase sigma-70 factor (ECF subfamily)
VVTGRQQLDRAQLEQLYARLETPMYNVVYRWLWNADDARDVVQEAFVKLWRVRARVELDTVEPYLYRIAVNLASKRRRSRKLWRWVSLDKAGARASDTPSARDSIDDEQRRAAVRAAVDALPEPQRRVVMLCEFSDMSYQQVADTLGIAIGTVGSRRNAALAKMRQTLTDEEHADAQRLEA